MGASAAKNLTLGVVAVVLFGFAYQVYIKKTKPPPVPAGPPAGAEYLDEGVTAEDIMVEYTGVKPAQREAVAAQYIGLWLPEQGWTGAVEGSSNIPGSRAVSVYYYKAAFIGGGFWVFCNVADPTDFKKGDHVKVRGRISSIDILPGGPAPIHRIVLEPSTVTAAPPS